MAKHDARDLPERMVRAPLPGQSRHAAARGFDGSASGGIKLMARFAITGNRRPRKFGGHKKHRLAAHEASVRAVVAARPDPTITEFWQKLTPLAIKVGLSGAFCGIRD